MYCRKCGKEILDDSRVCQYCGIAITSESPLSEGLQNTPSQSNLNTAAITIEQTNAEVTDPSKQSEDDKTTTEADTTKNTKPKRKTIVIATIAIIVVVTAVLIGVFFAGNNHSDPIIGEWKLMVVSTNEDTGQVDGKATIKNDGSASITFGKHKMTGTWEATPKSKWPDNAAEKYEGIYVIVLTLDEDTTHSFIGVIKKEDSDYKLIIVLEDDHDFQMIFYRDI